MKNNTTLFSLFGKALRIGGGAALLFIALCLLSSCDSNTAKEHTVVFDPNGGTIGGGNIHTATVLDGTAVADPGKAVLDGHVFLGWYTASVGGSKYSFNSPVTGSFTLYAQWANSHHTVTYHVLVNGEDKSPDYNLSAATVQHGSMLDLPSVALNISNPDLALAGWSTSKDNYLPVDEAYTVTGDTDLYAVIIDKTATGKIEVGGGYKMNYSYDTGTKGYSVCSAYDAMPKGAISIPSTTAVPVTAIANSAFSYDNNNNPRTVAKITSINIPSSVMIIHDVAFHSVVTLETVSFAEGSQLREIQTRAFYNCTKLASINLPESLETIGKSAFSYCSGIDTLTIPSNVHTIYENAFGYWTEGQTINIKHPDFSSQDINPSEWDIGWAAGCKAKILDANGNAVDVEAISSEPSTPEGPDPDEPDPEPSIPDEPDPDTGTPGFEYTVTYHVLVDGAASTDESIYTSLPPAEVKLYGTEIEEPSFTLLDDTNYALVGWSTDSVNYTGVEFPYTVKGETNLYAVLATRTGDGYKLKTNGGVLYFTYDATTGGYSVGSKMGEYPSGALVIPGSIGVDPVTKIADDAFGEYDLIDTDRPNITGITIPDSVKEIGSYAFAFLKAASITIPSSVEYLGDNAFFFCKSLASIEFAENSKLKTIDDYAFDCCMSLESITIPASVETIGYRAFNQCNALENVTFAENSQLKTLGDHLFSELVYIDRITIPESVTSVGMRIFYSWKSYQTIVLPFADEASIPDTWSAYWKEGCEAKIEYAT